MPKELILSFEYHRGPAMDGTYFFRGEVIVIPDLGEVVKSGTVNPPPGWLLAGFGCNVPGCDFRVESREPKGARTEFADHRKVSHFGLDVGSSMVFLYRQDPDYVAPEQPVRLPHKSGPRRR